VTHGLRWLPYVDNIIVMVNGTVVETGTYDDLLSSNGTFSNVLKIHMTEMEIKDGR
jgi:ABC-type transport system involved in cytochrome bd biosynthesis fused ATPase/permease subunit